MSSPRHPAVRAAGHLCRLLLAFVFLAAGALKALHPDGFADEVARYGILSGAAARVLAYLLIPAELVLGGALLLNYRPTMSLSAAVGLLLVFMAAIGYAIATDQPLQECGCFGRNTPRTPQQTLVEDVAFVGAGLLGLFALSGRRPASMTPGGGRWKAAALGVVLVGSGAFVVASPHLPIDDYATALRPGVRWEDLGVALAEADLSKGRWFVALLGMNDEASGEAVLSLNRMADGGPAAVIGLQGDDDEASNEFFWTRGPAFPLYHIAPTDMSRLHRRLPRYFMLVGGRVTATWDSIPGPDRIGGLLETTR